MNGSMRSLSLLAFLLIVAQGSVTAAGAEKPLPALEQSKAFLTAHCVSCHGNDQSKGGHNFETFNGEDWSNHELLNDRQHLYDCKLLYVHSLAMLALFGLTHNSLLN